ncbi:MAG: RNase adapter RapZ [Bacilli bacterium]
MEKIRLVILSGPSGSGKSSARYVFEELGYFVSENVFYDTVPSYLNSIKKFKPKINKFCLIVSIIEIRQIYDYLKDNEDFIVSFILLNSDEESLLKRFTLTRHIHPLSVIDNLSLEDAIKHDIESAINFKNHCDLYIDTSSLTVKELRSLLFNFLDNDKDGKTLFRFTTFGLKNGISKDIDTLLDVRVIPNPYWVEEFRSKTGTDKEVQQYMEQYPITTKLKENILSFLSFNLESIQNSGRASYNIGIACSGGKHRSVYIGEFLYRHFKNKYRCVLIHRDINKD